MRRRGALPVASVAVAGIGAGATDPSAGDDVAKPTVEKPGRR